ncbi:hypothetical protein NLX71_11350 [Paenibacillus sp. MZ04-78.2]|uniref:hypothetical protein n=1 Tax=Paenibacillus sp. MZ04-78.2 TaxID=2962034 RepID=UPI0020B8E16D|nr:hypothetical protein [Paenibacillus sp. MZ04-78.2]MCP3773895.1 hypothetical protein [Paenibacillus sp. MZ04-78.2]
MARGLFDVVVNPEHSEDTMTVVANCINGYEHELHTLRDGTMVVLKKEGSPGKEIRIVREHDDECLFHYIEMGPATAQAAKLRGGARCLLEYNELEQTMTLTKISVNKERVIVLTEKGQPEPGVRIGYSLLIKLGMADARRSRTVRARRGNTSVKLRLSVPQNELSEQFVLSAGAAAKLRLGNGQPCLLAYDQAARTLSFSPLSDAPESVDPSTGSAPNDSAQPIKSSYRSRSAQRTVAKTVTASRSGKSRTRKTAPSRLFVSKQPKAPKPEPSSKTGESAVWISPKLRRGRR